MDTVVVYTDGSASPNPGRGGYAALVYHDERREPLTVTGGYCHTTNNRMELMAVIAALEVIAARSLVLVVTDSQYVSKGRDWAKNWRRKGWRKRDGQPALNVDLWERLLDQCQRHQVEFQWVRGHVGHPQNERCDALAAEAAASASEVDTVYEALGA